jgi:dUTP pyrophosphatase
MVHRVTIKVKRVHPDAVLPTYAHSGPLGDLAADLYCAEPKELKPGQVTRVRTGLQVEMPEGFGAIIEDRSGLATRGLCTLAGVVDPGYRGEIKVVLAHLGTEPITIKVGDRIAQMRIVRRIEAGFVEVDEVSPSSRNEGGFGSTGD